MQLSAGYHDLGVAVDNDAAFGPVKQVLCPDTMKISSPTSVLVLLCFDLALSISLPSAMSLSPVFDIVSTFYSTLPPFILVFLQV